MKSKEELVLAELLESLSTKSFDLDAWKIKAKLLVKKIFGSEDEKLALINELHYDYSSWSLRDESGKQQSDRIKEKAIGIVEGAILELSLNTTKSSVEMVMEALGDDEREALQKLIAERKDEADFTKYFSKIAPDIKDKLLAQFVLDSLR